MNHNALSYIGNLRNARQPVAGPRLKAKRSSTIRFWNDSAS
eukprot:SAG31_NODE_3240_length_4506_cov_2.792830_1_plen_41_part_00